MRRLGRIRLSTIMDLRDLRRRPLILVLLIVTPIVFISRAIANTEALPRTVNLADGTTVATTMRAIHGADMTIIAVAFLAGLVGVFIMNSAREADGRLAHAGFGATNAVVARLVVLLVCTLIVTGVALLVTSRSFSPTQWAWFAVGNLVIGITYAGIGAMASGMLGRVAATYLLLFLAMLDLGIVQNPMFGNGSPPSWALALPGYPATRTVMAAALSPGQGMPNGIVFGMLAWMIGVVAVTIWSLSLSLHRR